MAKGEKMKHKHAELIKQWADGAEIECKHSNGSWFWCTPDWDEDCEYRIKPEEKKPVVRWLWANKGGSSYCLNSMIFATEEEAAMNKLQMFKLEWSRTEFPE